MSLLYEALALAALIWGAAFLYSAVEHILKISHSRAIFQVFFVLVMGAYFIGQWMRGGQTLAMKTWRLRLESANGRPLTLRQAILRYAVAFLGTLALGITFLWGFVDRDRAFLHDRIAGTRIVRT